MKKRFLLLSMLGLGASLPYGAFCDGQLSLTGFDAQAQTRTTVKGTVIDEDGEPLIGAVVTVKGTNVSTVTDIDGRYELPAEKGATLVITFIGYQPLEIKAGTPQAVMQSSSTLLNEVEITGEFGLKRVARSVGSSTQNVKASDITDAMRTDFITALQGRVSGMNIASTSGQPGASTKVTLRSITSLSGSNQPLYVIDGVPINNSTFDPVTGFADDSAVDPRYYDFSSRGNDINPDDIEEMTVLKGAAAAALYGSDASNGAIIITTKKGKAGRASVTYSNQFSWANAYGWPEEQTKYANGAYGTTNQYYTSKFGGDFTGPVYDNQKALYQTGFTQRHNVAVEGGTEKASMRASASWLDQTGVLKTTELQRNNLSLSGKAQISKYFRVEGTMQYTHQENQKARNGAYGPLYCSYIWPNSDDMSVYMAEDGIHMKYPENYTDTDLLNPLYGLNKNLNEDKTDRFIGTMTAHITPTNNTWIRAQVGYDFSNSTYQVGTHPYYRSANQSYNDGSGGSYNISKYNTNDPTLNILAGWNDKFFDDRFTVSAQVGYHQLENGVSALSVSGSNFLVVDFFSINNCTTSTLVSKKTETKRRIQAISMAAEFGINNVLFAAFRARNDWSSTLPTDNNSYFYPAVEASFIPSDLGFIRSSLPEWVNFFKIRGSFAQVGKDAPVNSINPELEASDYYGGGYRYGFTGPNPNLKPEMNTSWEAGFETRLWNDRIKGDFTYYWTKCEDQIVSGFRMSYATGFVLNTLNVGSFKTWGWEAHVDVDVVSTKDFTWNIGINASQNHSEVLELPEGLDEYYNAYTWIVGNIRNGTSVGQPITSITALGYERNDYGEILINPTTGRPVVSSEWTVVGDREPKLRYGINTFLRYKNWRLSANFAGRAGATMVNGTAYYLYYRGISQESADLRESGYATLTGVLQDGNENTENRNYTNVTLGLNSSTSGYGYYYGSWEDYVQKNVYYIRCQDLRLSYTIPSRWLKRVTRGVMDNASIFVAGSDLFTITNYKGLDVVGNGASASLGGSGAEGWDCFGLPSPRTYTVGCSVTF